MPRWKASYRSRLNGSGRIYRTRDEPDADVFHYSDSRCAMAAIAHTAPPFAKLPPQWQLDLDAWNGRRE
jgi:hypothetical protein